MLPHPTLWRLLLKTSSHSRASQSRLIPGTFVNIFPFSSHFYCYLFFHEICSLLIDIIYVFMTFPNTVTFNGYKFFVATESLSNEKRFMFFWPLFIWLFTQPQFTFPGLSVWRRNQYPVFGHKFHQTPMKVSSLARCFNCLACFTRLSPKSYSRLRTHHQHGTWQWMRLSV